MGNVLNKLAFGAIRAETTEIVLTQNSSSVPVPAVGAWNRGEKRGGKQEKCMERQYTNEKGNEG